MCLQNEGRLDLTADATTWTARTGDSRRAIDLRRVGSAHWVDAGRACQLWLREGSAGAEGGAGSAGAAAAPWSSGELHRFEGFKVADFEAVAGILESSPVAGTLAGGAPGAGVKLQRLKPSLRGRNWGTWVMAGKTLEWHEMKSDGAPGSLIAAIPLASVAQAVYTGKGEVDLQFLDEGESLPSLFRQLRAAAVHTATRLVHSFSTGDRTGCCPLGERLASSTCFFQPAVPALSVVRSVC